MRPSFGALKLGKAWQAHETLRKVTMKVYELVAWERAVLRAVSSNNQTDRIIMDGKKERNPNKHADPAAGQKRNPSGW